jgi:integrase
VATRKQGEVKERYWKSGRGYALRFWAYGERHYLTLGLERDGWTRCRAEEELANVMADVRRGFWVPPTKVKKGKRASDGAKVEPEEAMLFGPFARQRVAARVGEVSENQTAYEEWALSHLLPYFADWPLREIDVEAVDDYRTFKVKEAEARRAAIEQARPRKNARGQILKPLSASSINKSIDVLQWLLGVALEYGRVTENAAVGKRRRLTEPPKRPVHLDSAGQIETLLEAAAEMDRSPRYRCSERHAIIATLVFTGARAHELCNLLWRDVDLANGRIFVGRSKTQAGLREITILPVLRDVIAAHKAAAYRTGPDDLVFPTGTGGRRTKDNLREHVLIDAFARADGLLVERGQVPLPKGLTAHKLRHTFASILIALGEDPPSVMAQLGHSDPTFTLRVYTHLMSREPAERQRLKTLVRGERVIVREPTPIRHLDASNYERPILRALVDRGGEAPRREILAAVGEVMAGRHTTLDIEPLPSGPPRWQAQVGKARTRLVERGWLRSDSPRGRWELTRLGTAKARRDERKSNGHL